ncbi:MAG: imidazoleglycerol-phosphate dehydratase HisB [Clostridiales bacterium]|nr:imidazoleglycerol-phosphate dehydratase HisB [Clostridiales bacterium]
MRTAELNRKTTETDIAVRLDLDGNGNSEISTGCGFLDHMLTLFSKHGRFDLSVFCEGDVEVDFHHSAEDIGITLGTAFNEALGDRRGIRRYGEFTLPMDEALVQSVIDCSGRGFLSFDLEIPTEKVGDFDTELVEEFFIAFARNSGMTIHIRKISGKNSHHIIEGAFKAFARALKEAVDVDPDFSDDIPSTKGVL